MVKFVSTSNEKQSYRFIVFKPGKYQYSKQIIPPLHPFIPFRIKKKKILPWKQIDISTFWFAEQKSTKEIKYAEGKGEKNL